MDQNRQDDGPRREGFIKDGTSIRSRVPSGSGRKTMPRIMWLAILVCIAGAALLFRGSSQDVPTSIGERRTVVTAPTQMDGDTPRSGEVDLSDQTQDLTPEQPVDGTAAVTEEAPPQEEPAARETPPVAAASSTPATVTPPVTTPVESEPPVLIQPTSAGQYAVQTGAFGTPENADKEASRLKEHGWDARVKAGNTSSGDMVYRVWICYFPSRQVAGDFIKQESAKIPGAIVVHR